MRNSQLIVFLKQSRWEEENRHWAIDMNFDYRSRSDRKRISLIQRWRHHFYSEFFDINDESIDDVITYVYCFTYFSSAYITRAQNCFKFQFRKWKRNKSKQNLVSDCSHRHTNDFQHMLQFFCCCFMFYSIRIIPFREHEPHFSDDVIFMTLKFDSKNNNEKLRAAKNAREKSKCFQKNVLSLGNSKLVLFWAHEKSIKPTITMKLRLFCCCNVCANFHCIAKAERCIQSMMGI